MDNITTEKVWVAKDNRSGKYWNYHEDKNYLRQWWPERQTTWVEMEKESVVKMGIKRLAI